MYSVAIFSDPISYITCEISVHFFFILCLWIDNYSMAPMRYKPIFHYLILIRGLVQSPKSCLWTYLFFLWFMLTFHRQKHNSIWKHRWVFPKIGWVVSPYPACPTQNFKISSNSWPMIWSIYLMKVFTVALGKLSFTSLAWCI